MPGIVRNYQHVCLVTKIVYGSFFSRKNNIAAKKSRATKKMREDQLSLAIVGLEKAVRDLIVQTEENFKLLRAENAYLR